MTSIRQLCIGVSNTLLPTEQKNAKTNPIACVQSCKYGWFHQLVCSLKTTSMFAGCVEIEISSLPPERDNNSAKLYQTLVTIVCKSLHK